MSDNIQNPQVIYRRQFLTEVERGSTPKFPKYASAFEREKSYEKWGNVSCLSKDKLIDAGFFYTGIEDATCCFHCSKTLKNWGVNHDPLKEHATHNPVCPFILAQHGKGTIQRRSRILNELNEDHDGIPMLVSFIKGMSAENEELTQENQRLKRTIQNFRVKQARMRNTVTVEGSYTEDPGQNGMPTATVQERPDAASQALEECGYSLEQISLSKEIFKERNGHANHKATDLMTIIDDEIQM